MHTVNLFVYSIVNSKWKKNLYQNKCQTLTTIMSYQYSIPWALKNDHTHIPKTLRNSSSGPLNSEGADVQNSLLQIFK